MKGALSFIFFGASILCVTDADTIPDDWSVKVRQLNALFAENDDAPINHEGYPEIYTPLIGNGYLAHSKGVRSDTYYVSGIFNGETTSPSHRARIPATLAIQVSNSVTTGTLLDMKEGTYHRRGNLTNSGDWYELRWYAHMTLRHLLVMEFEVHFSSDSTTDNVTIQFSNNAGDPSSDINFSSDTILINKERHILSCGNTIEPETAEVQSLAVCIASPNVSAPFVVSRHEDTKSFTYVTAVYTSLDSGANVKEEAVAGYKTASYMPNSKLRGEHVAAWNELWESGVEIVGDKRSDAAVAVNASWFAILSSVRQDWPYGLAPGGLTNYYNGHSFWDTETWMYPPLLAMHPGVASSLVQYRFNRLQGAQDKAKTYTPPYEGAMFPWESALTGVETCPEWAPTGLREQHISADISLSVWQYYSVTKDSIWLKDVGMPILIGIADFYVSRAEFDEKGQAHINGVIPPDEYVDNVDDSVYTNFAAAQALRFTVDAASAIGESLKKLADYVTLADSLVVLFDSELGVHPEYLGYTGDIIKQADAVMLHYPWGLSMNSSVQQSDLEYYSARSDENGPAMTWGMHSIGFKDLAMYEDAAGFFDKSFQDNMQHPFLVWTETPSGNAGNFITGAGGFLQTVINGYPGLRVENDRLFLSSPTCPKGADGVKLRGLWYLGSRMDVSYRCSSGVDSVCEEESLAIEISVRLTVDGGVSLALLQYDFLTENVVESQHLILESTITLTVPCEIEATGTHFAIVQIGK